MRTYSCEGAVRGECGHAHRTLRGAMACVARDRAWCRAQGGYSDRQPVAITGRTSSGALITRGLDEAEMQATREEDF